MKLIADNLRITRPDVQAALEKKDPEPIRKIVRQCEAAGAWAIDVNTGPMKKNCTAQTTFFMAAVQSATTLPLLIDTSNPDAMAAAIDAAQNRLIINGFSLETEKLEKILPLAAAHDLEIVGFLLYPGSRVPRDENERYDIAIQVLDHARSAGVPPEHLIIDPVVPPLTWEDGLQQARAVIQVIRTLPELLDAPVRTIAGLSNLATGGPDKAAKDRMTECYAALLAGAGLSYLLMDVNNKSVRSTALAADLLMDQDIFSWGMVP